MIISIDKEMTFNHIPNPFMVLKPQQVRDKMKPSKLDKASFKKPPKGKKDEKPYNIQFDS